MDYKKYSEFCDELYNLTDKIVKELNETSFDEFLKSIITLYLDRIKQNCRSATILFSNMQNDFELSLGLMFRANVLDMINIFYLSGFLITNKLEDFKLALLRLQTDSLKKYYNNLFYAYDSANKYYVDNDENETANKQQLERILRLLYDRLPAQYPDLIDITKSEFPKLEFKYNWSPTKHIIEEIYKMTIPEDQEMDDGNSLDLYHRITGRLFALYSEYSQYEHASEVAILFNGMPFETRHINLIDSIYMLNKSAQTCITILMESKQKGILKSKLSLNYKIHNDAIELLNKKMMQNYK